jgi:hypothetical protein
LNAHFQTNIFFAALAAGAICAGSIRAETLVQGDYLEDDFVRVLRQTHSPYAAFMADESRGVPQVIRASIGSNGLCLDANYNWHEGTTLLCFSEHGSITHGESWSEAYRRLHILDQKHFTLPILENSAAGIHYSFVVDADRMIASIALVGQYADDHGARYEFKPDGTIEGLKGAFLFTFNNELIFQHFDYFILDGDPKRALAFRHNGSKLVLYKASLPTEDGPGTYVADFGRPMLTLHRLEK